MSPSPANCGIANNWTFNKYSDTLLQLMVWQGTVFKRKALETNNDCRFEVLTALVLLKVYVIWNVLLCHWANRAFHLHVSLVLWSSVIRTLCSVCFQVRYCRILQLLSKTKKMSLLNMYFFISLFSLYKIILMLCSPFKPQVHPNKV